MYSAQLGLVVEADVRLAFILDDQGIMVAFIPDDGIMVEDDALLELIVETITGALVIIMVAFPLEESCAKKILGSCVDMLPNLRAKSWLQCETRASGNSARDLPVKLWSKKRSLERCRCAIPKSRRTARPTFSKPIFVRKSSCSSLRNNNDASQV